MAAEASKLLKGVDAVALHLAKTALTTDASVSEAPNVGKSYNSVANSDIDTRYLYEPSYRSDQQLSEILRVVLDKCRKPYRVVLDSFRVLRWYSTD